MTMKLYLAKNFDRIRNSYIFQVMQNYGFLEAFIQWFKACIIKPWLSPLITGCPTSFFQGQRGVRKGFPMSRFLYILVAYFLNRRLNRIRNEGNISGISIARGAQAIDHS